ncbi:MAG: nicotinate phosphoribosyltransferase [Syntrophobacteraceae bacterium]|nr:nicotinate phosphoribosyltransferase [Syntrophobacteraceae bacterium]
MNSMRNALFADLYGFTMSACYFENRMFAPAAFSLYIRKYGPHRSYYVSAGLEEVVEFLESFRFAPEEIDYLQSTGLFSTDFLNYLESLRFTGEVFAIPEGRLFFKDEPILEITAPVIEAQLIESFVINAINLQVSIASKAARCIHAAGGKNLVDFSLRRTQGTDAGMKVARASYIAGFKGTSNVLAGMAYGIPIAGTMAHSFVLSFEEEIEAFRAFARTFPDRTVLLIDTYDTVTGAKKAAEVGREMAKRGERLKGVRLDSGDITQLSKEVRGILDEAGLKEVIIFASGGFDEYEIEEALSKGARIDAFGVGTKMGVSADAPYNDIAYKLVEYDGRPVLKLSRAKKTLVNQKQVFREVSGGKMSGDTIGRRAESLPGEPLLECVMRGGKRQVSPQTLETIRERFLSEFSSLGDEHKAIKSPKDYPVRLSPMLEAAQSRTVREVRKRELGESS